MLNMIYISPKEKLSVEFSLALEQDASFSDCRHLITQFGKEVDIPFTLIEGLHDQELDRLLMLLSYKEDRLFERYIYKRLPLTDVSSYCDSETEKVYHPYGINPTAILLQRVDDLDILAAAQHDEFKTRFITTTKERVL